MQPVRTVGLIVKPHVPEARRVVPELVEWLRARGIAVRYDAPAAGYLGRKDGLTREDLVPGCELVLVLGGDGTLLAASRALKDKEIPLLAVNLGGLGFLTATTVDELYPELECALAGESRVVTRAKIQCALMRSRAKVSEYEALNDVVITKASLARMIDLETCVDSQLMCTYKADGLIISTPTGSTAYSLSANGPIVFPSVAGTCITPICPHTLTNRPVIVPDTSEITVTNLASNGDAYLTIDGQEGQALNHRDEVVCRHARHSLHLVRPHKLSFFDVLRTKLKWGER